VVEGKAFVGVADGAEASAVGSGPLIRARKGSLTLHIHYGKKRFESRPFDCAVDFSVNETFALKLGSSFTEPIHLVLSQTMPGGETSCVASCHYAWQHAVSDSGSANNGGKAKMKTVEMDGVGAAASFPAGALSVRAEFRHGSGSDLSSGLAEQFAAERSLLAERENLFLA
jgi:hypothetical protein